jgi:hypothetical protein
VAFSGGVFVGYRANQGWIEGIILIIMSVKVPYRAKDVPKWMKQIRP